MSIRRALVASVSVCFVSVSIATALHAQSLAEVAAAEAKRRVAAQEPSPLQAQSLVEIAAAEAKRKALVYETTMVACLADAKAANARRACVETAKPAGFKDSLAEPFPLASRAVEHGARPGATASTTDPYAEPKKYTNTDLPNSGIPSIGEPAPTTPTPSGLPVTRSGQPDAQLASLEEIKMRGQLHDAQQTYHAHKRLLAETIQNYAKLCPTVHDQIQDACQDLWRNLTFGIPDAIKADERYVIARGRALNMDPT